MKIIATTTDGVLISATKAETNEILTAVNGVKPEELKIGMKIPAIDYASTIKKIQTLENNYEFKQLRNYVSQFTKEFATLDIAVANASKLTVD